MHIPHIEDLVCIEMLFTAFEVIGSKEAHGTLPQFSPFDSIKRPDKYVFHILNIYKYGFNVVKAQ